MQILCCSAPGQAQAHECTLLPCTDARTIGRARRAPSRSGGGTASRPCGCSRRSSGCASRSRGTPWCGASARTRRGWPPGRAPPAERPPTRAPACMATPPLLHKDLRRTSRWQGRPSYGGIAKTRRGWPPARAPPAACPPTTSMHAQRQKRCCRWPHMGPAAARAGLGALETQPTTSALQRAQA